MSRLVRLTAAISLVFVFCIAVTLAVEPAQGVPPFLLSGLAQDMFLCRPSASDCGFDAASFTLVEADHRTWHRLSTDRPSLGDLLLALGRPEGTDGDRVVVWKGLYAELAQPLDLHASVAVLVLEPNLQPLTPWRGL